MIIRPRSEEELKLMRQSGSISASAMQKVIEAVKPGVSLLEVEKIAEEEIIRLGGQPSFKSVPNYFWTTCLNINNEVVHGIPRDITLKKGDKFSVDLGTVFKGWHTDTAWSVIVGEAPSKFLKVGEKALWAGIDKAVSGNRIGDISEAIQDIVEDANFSVVRTLVGHGIGRQLHEEPEVPGFGKKGTGLALARGMTLAIEVIYTAGSPEVVLNDDKWTIATADGSLGGLFEMSVIVGDKSAEVITDWRGQ